MAPELEFCNPKAKFGSVAALNKLKKPGENNE